MDAEEFFNKNRLRSIYIKASIGAYIIGYSDNLSDNGYKDLIIITPIHKCDQDAISKITLNKEPWKHEDFIEDHLAIEVFQRIRNNGIYYLSIKEIEKLNLLIN